MKKRLKNFFIVALTILLLPIQIVNATPIQDNPTFEDIENELFDYFKSNNLYYEKDSEEYVDYLLSILMYNEDDKLMQHPNYDNILVYASKYLNEIEGRESSEIEYIIDTLEEKPLDEIKEEIKENDLNIDNEIMEFKENNNDTITLYSAYNRTNAKNYAMTWAYKRNNLYNSHPYDCTNFVSQAIFAGGKPEKKLSPLPTGIKNTTSYWYSDRYDEWKLNYSVYKWKESTSWIRVTDFYSYWAKTQKVVTSSNVNTIISNANIGDVIQLKNKSGAWYHSMIVVNKANGTLTLAGHTSNTNNRNIKDISKDNSFRVIKFS